MSKPAVSRGLRRPLKRGVAIAALLAGAVAQAGELDQIGGGQLLLVNPTLTGTGVYVAQPEASSEVETSPGVYVDQNDFEVDPSAVNPSNPMSVPPITYINSSGTVSTVFQDNPPNFVPSWHAGDVASLFYGPTGVAPNVAGVLNYDANYFILNVIFGNQPINAKVINQSFTFTVNNSSDAAEAQQLYDNYVDTYNSIIVSAVGNPPLNFTVLPPVQLPATAYNVIAVGTYGGSTDSGSPDGRSKPDIVAPGSYSSESAALVSGAATLLVQAGNEISVVGAGNQTAATDARTIKALLLNGADKTYGWTHNQTTPLDFYNGAGVVDIMTSYNILAAGKQNVSSSSQVSINQAHNAVFTGTPVGLSGWNLQSISSASTFDGLNHYVLNLSGSTYYDVTATITWNQPYSAGNTPLGINNLDLFLMNGLGQVAASTSSIDNVEQLASVLVPAGSYDLQVLKRGGSSGNPNWVTSFDTYAIAWNVIPVSGNANSLTLPLPYTEISQSQTLGDIGGMGNTLQVDGGATLTSTGYVTLGQLTINGTSSGIASPGIIQIGNGGNSGTLSASNVVNNGTLVFNRTGVSVATLGYLTGNGALSHIGPGTTTLTGSYQATGPINVAAGRLVLPGGPTAVLASGLSIAGGNTPTATLDIQDGGVAISYTDPGVGATLTSTLYAQAVAARGVQNPFTSLSPYDQPGLTSSTAAFNNAAAGFDQYGVGVINNADIAAIGIDAPYTSFMGQTVGVDTVLARYTYMGDINLDGKIDANDVSYLINSFNGFLPSYSGLIAADFDDNGVIDANDVGVLVAGFNFQGAPLDAGGLTPLASPAVNIGSGSGAAPEPASLMLLGLGAMGILKRRRRKE